MLRLALGTFALAFALGCILGAFRGLLLIALGLLSIAAGLLYSAGPHPIAGTPYGECTVFALMGLLETWVSEVAAVGRLTPAAVYASLSVGFLVAAILTANNLRDRVSDQERGRRTLAILLGEERGMALLRAEVAAAVLLPPLATLAGLLPWPAALPLLLGPQAWRVGRDRALPKLLPQVSRLHLLSGLLLTLGLGFAAALR